VNNPRNEGLFSGLGVDAPVSETKIINAVIQEQMKAGDMMIPLLTLKAGNVEIAEVELFCSSHIVKEKVKNLSLPPGSISIGVIRRDEVIIPLWRNRVRTRRQSPPPRKAHQRASAPEDAVIQFSPQNCI
jgi:Trk K+ transport system NAD-binding subunit